MIIHDCESDLIAPGLLAPELACIAYQQRGHAPELVHQADPMAYEVARWIVANEATTANGVYDYGVYAAKWPDLLPAIFEAFMEGRIHCVQNRQKLIDIGLGIYRRVYKRVSGKLTNLGYSLNDLSIRHLGQVMEKDQWRLRYGEFKNIPLEYWPEGAKQYPKQDVISTGDVHFAQEAETTINLHDEPAQMRAHWALHLTSCWGLNTDNAQVDRLLREVHAEQVQRKSRLVQMGLVRLDGSRNKKAAQARFLRLAGSDLSDLKLTDKGKKLVKRKEMTREEAIHEGFFTMDEEACEETNDATLVDYAIYGQFKTLESKVAALGVAFPVQTRFEPILETGRTSSSGRKKTGSKETEPGSVAIQNPPRAEGFRECFIPSNGMVFVSCDYDVAELVSLAEVCYAWFGFSKLRDALNEGMDPHLHFAAQLLGITYEEALSRKEEDEVDEARQRSKVCNFGFPGGLGARGFRNYARGYGLELTEAECKALKQQWLRQWPEMPMYFKRIRQILNSNGKVEVTDDGDEILRGAVEQHGSGRIRSGCKFTEACNTEFQGLTATAAKEAMFEVSRRCYTALESALYGCRIVNFVHDELIIEAPEPRAHEAAMELKQVMAEVYQRFTPNTRISTEAAMMRRWRKGAKPYLVNGRLRPWEESPGFAKKLAEGKIKVAA